MMFTRYGIMVNAYGMYMLWCICEMYVIVQENKSLIAAGEILGGWIPDCRWGLRICISSNFVERMLSLGNISWMSTVIWSNPGFTICWGWNSQLLPGRIHASRKLTGGRDELTVIWWDSRLCRKLSWNWIVIWSDPRFTTTCWGYGS